MNVNDKHRPLSRWPLYLIATSAAVAIWSGWVGLGEMCGFGIIHPLPGIFPAFRLNMAITLPISVEAYGAYALGAWMSPASPPGARKFAKWSAFGALAYGAAGQIIYHLLAAAGAVRAPWPVVVVVSCMPVAVLGLAAGLTHLLRAGEGEPEVTEHVQQTVLDKVPSDVLTAAKASMRATYAAGNPLSVNQLQKQFTLTRAQATEVRDVVFSQNGDGPHE